MRPFSRVLVAAATVLAIGASRAAAQNGDDSFKWYLSAQGGVLGFETQSQTRGWAPSVGGSLLVTARRTGLLLSVDEVIGNDEVSAIGDASGVRSVTFDRIRKYAATLIGYPIRGAAQPYVGVGFGLLQTINPQPGGFFTNPSEVSAAQSVAKDRSTNGFMAFTAGLQFRVGRAMAFGQYQITTSPGQDALLRGVSHALTGGLRFSLGSAREGIRGGGY